MLATVAYASTNMLLTEYTVRVGQTTILRLAVLLCGAAFTSAEGDAHVILRKDVISERCDIEGSSAECVVAGQETEILYGVYNVGEGTAFGVTVADSSLDESFELVGDLDGTIGEIEGGANKTVTLIAKPKEAGELTVGPAKVSYKLAADGELQSGVSTEPQKYFAETERAHKKRTSIHYLEWTVFLIAAAVPVIVPGNAYQAEVSKKSA